MRSGCARSSHSADDVIRNSGCPPSLHHRFRSVPVVPDPFRLVSDSFRMLPRVFLMLPDAVRDAPCPVHVTPSTVPALPEACPDAPARVPDVPQRFPVVPCPLNVALTERFEGFDGFEGYAERVVSLFGQADAARCASACRISAEV